MNDKEKTAVAFAIGVVIITTVNYIKIVRDERRKRIAIEAETKLQIQAMRVHRSEFAIVFNVMDLTALPSKTS